MANEHFQQFVKFLVNRPDIKIAFENVSTASFNIETKTITIPKFLPPELTESIIGAILHECLHVTDTNLNFDNYPISKRFASHFRQQFFSNYFNTIEDIRINKIASDKHTRGRELINKVYEILGGNLTKKLVNKDFDEWARNSGQTIAQVEKDFKTLESMVMDYVIYQRSGVWKQFPKEFMTDEALDWIKKNEIDDLIDRAENAKNSKEAERIAFELYQKLLGEKEAKRRMMFKDPSIKEILKKFGKKSKEQKQKELEEDRKKTSKLKQDKENKEEEERIQKEKLDKLRKKEEMLKENDEEKEKSIEQNENQKEVNAEAKKQAEEELKKLEEEQKEEIKNIKKRIEEAKKREKESKKEKPITKEEQEKQQREEEQEQEEQAEQSERPLEAGDTVVVTKGTLKGNKAVVTKIDRESGKVDVDFDLYREIKGTAEQIESGELKMANVSEISSEKSITLPIDSVMRTEEKKKKEQKKEEEQQGKGEEEGEGGTGKGEEGQEEQMSSEELEEELEERQKEYSDHRKELEDQKNQFEKEAKNQEDNISDEESEKSENQKQSEENKKDIKKQKDELEKISKEKQELEEEIKREEAIEREKQKHENDEKKNNLDEEIEEEYERKVKKFNYIKKEDLPEDIQKKIEEQRGEANPVDLNELEDGTTVIISEGAMGFDGINRLLKDPAIIQKMRELEELEGREDLKTTFKKFLDNKMHERASEESGYIASRKLPNFWNGDVFEEPTEIKRAKTFIHFYCDASGSMREGWGEQKEATDEAGRKYMRYFSRRDWVIELVDSLLNIINDNADALKIKTEIKLFDGLLIGYNKTITKEDRNSIIKWFEDRFLKRGKYHFTTSDIVSAKISPYSKSDSYPEIDTIMTIKYFDEDYDKKKFEGLYHDDGENPVQGMLDDIAEINPTPMEKHVVIIVTDCGFRKQHWEAVHKYSGVVKPVWFGINVREDNDTKELFGDNIAKTPQELGDVLTKELLKALEEFL